MTPIRWPRIDTSPTCPSWEPLLPTLNLNDLMRVAIRQALARSSNVEEAAKLLGVGRSTLYKWVVRLKWEYSVKVSREW